MKEEITVLISREEIDRRISELAEKLNADYKGKKLTLVCVLKGAVMFLVDLSRKITVDVEIYFMDVSSYGNSTTSSGKIKINMDLDRSIENKHVVIVEDIIDTGRTLNHLVDHLAAQNPASLKLCTLLDKPDRRYINEVIIDYTGFVIPDKFVVGYGLDYCERYRNLPFIGELHLRDE